MEILALFLFGRLDLTTPIRLFSPVEEPGGYGEDGNDHKDGDRYDTCGAESIRKHRDDVWVVQPGQTEPTTSKILHHSQMGTDRKAGSIIGKNPSVKRTF